MTPYLSVVFPVYNEEENVAILLEEIARALDGTGWSYEIVAVDDTSTDGSLAVLRRSRSQYPSLRILALEKNSGQTAALDAGWRAARGELVVSLDADLQNDPADIPHMMRRLEESGADMVIGIRMNRRDTFARKVQSKIGNTVRNWITGDAITDTGCSLKLVRRQAIERVRLFTGMHRFLPTLVRMEGHRVVEMPVNHRPRRFGVSKYGATNRAFRGLADCLAVRWMARRNLRYRVREEGHPVIPSVSEGSGREGRRSVPPTRPDSSLRSE
ncbi:MAG TPA: glycosyltransferase family 2 protein [Thermoanaerobaculia bacterium]|nr:glycosyltransferase family 2 protein [Thermoanaerobaculia bacterium]